MEMPSFAFLLYFLPVLLLGYFLLSFSAKAQNLWLIVGSLVFYALGNHAYTLILAGLVLVNFLLGRVAGRLAIGARNEKKMRKVVWVACVVNLLPLVFFSYLPVPLNALCGLLGLEPIALPAMPLGLAFLALKGISYVVDICRRRVPHRQSFMSTALYLTFFPSLPAGPIIRYHEVAAQIEKRRVSREGVANGICRFIVGLAKAVVLGGPLLAVADIVFNQSNISGIYATVPVSLAWLGVLACMMGLYHGLSGFSDMAIGLGGVFGFVLPENFRHPHLAASVESFWQRCFSTMGTWFDDYVYQPLTSKRTNNDGMVLHTLLIWLLIGLWLGPDVPNLILAVWSFAFILVERIIELDPANTRSPLRHFFVLVFIPVAVIALRTDSVYQFTLYISNMFGMRDNGFASPLALTLLRENWPVLAAGFVASFPLCTWLHRFTLRKRSFMGCVVSLAYPVAMVVLVVLVVLALSSSSYNPYLMVQQYLWS
ncbi:hypothetical protein LJC33_00200 [Eubacteriales bacterium OttesenSCG-928-N13]|nr:hypothetical protein [Eubacteriales bacterium OttesenSCG-928-N13]